MDFPIHSHSHGLIGRAILTIALCAVGIAGTAAPANAAKTSVSISAPGSVSQPSVTVSGTVGGRSAGAAVILRKQIGGAWSTMQSGKVGAAGTYSFIAPVTAGMNQFQVKAKKSKRLKKAGVSATVVVSATLAPTSELEAARATILAETNAFRAQQGRPALVPMAELDSIAQAWTLNLSFIGELVHNLTYFLQYPGDPSAGAENIAYGYTPETVVDAWISSPGHRANLLGSYSHIGIGFARADDGTEYFTQDFARY